MSFVTFQVYQFTPIAATSSHPAFTSQDQLNTWLLGQVGSGGSTGPDEYAIAATTIAKSARTGGIKYVLVGNSFGEGYPVGGRNPNLIFFNLVSAGLRQQYGDANVTSVNLSVGGRSTQWMLEAANLAAVQAELDSAPAGAQVLLQWMEGTNELWWDNPNGGNHTAAEALADLTSWVNTFKSHACRPIILTATTTPRRSLPFTTPVSANDTDNENRRRAYNIGVRQNYAASVEGVVDITHTSLFVDNQSTLLDSALWHPDGVHPNEPVQQDIATKTLAAATPRLNTVIVPGDSRTDAVWVDLHHTQQLAARQIRALNTSQFDGVAGTTKALAAVASGVGDAQLKLGPLTSNNRVVADFVAGLTNQSKATRRQDGESYGDIRYGFYLNNVAGQVRIFESGSGTLLSSSYAAADIFRWVPDTVGGANVIKLYQNATLLHTYQRGSELSPLYLTISAASANNGSAPFVGQILEGSFSADASLVDSGW